MSSTAADGLALERVFPGKSAMAARMRAFDWSTTDLGAPPTWPSTLRVALGICLSVQLPMQIWWGPARTFFYNDACLSLLDATNQDSFGRTGGENWAKLVPQISPEIEQVFATGAENGPVASRLVFNADHPQREIDVTFSFSPLLGESGAVEGVFGVCSEPPALPDLRASEETLSAFVNATSDIVYEMSADWREMHFLKGKAFIATTENSRSDWMEEYIPAEEKQRVWATIQQAIATQRNFELEHRIIRLDGTVGWTFSRAVPLLDERGEVIKWFGAASDITERKIAEARLYESEEKYRTLFDSIDEAFALCQIITDDAGKAIDYRLLELNPTFEKMTGLTVADALGKTAREVVPGIEDWWIETYGRVALEGETYRFENRVEEMDRWFDAYASPVGANSGGKFTLVFQDITERKQQERQREFILKLNDALRPLNDPIAVQEIAMRILGEHLGVDRAFYGEVLADEDTLLIGPGYSNELPPLVGQVKFSEFDADSMMNVYRAGQTVVIHDRYSDAELSPAAKVELDAIGVQAAVGVPLVKSGKVCSILSVHQSVPRRWTQSEIVLLEETAERTWTAVERAKAEAALRKSEEQQAFLLKLSDALRPLSDAVKIQRTVMQLVGEFLEVDCALYSEIRDGGETIHIEDSYVRGEFSKVTGDFLVRTFGAAMDVLRRGEVLVIEDQTTTPLKMPLEREASTLLGMFASATVPLIKAGRWVANLGVLHGSSRQWTENEIVILQETADRTWSAVQRARTEEALRESERVHAFHSAILAATHDPVCAVDQDFKIVYWNDAATRVFGWTTEEALGRYSADVFQTAVPASLREDVLAKLFATGEYRGEVIYRHKDGHLIYTEATSRVVRGPNGEFEQLVSVLRDITERKRRELNAALLDEIGKDLSVLSTPDEVIEAVGTRLGEFLDASSCIFADVDEAKNEATIHHGWNAAHVPSLKQTFRLADYFGEEFARAGRAGETVIVRDTGHDERANAEAYARLQLGAFVTVPFQRHGRWTANITVTSREPRDWRANEIELLQEIAARVFPRIERARAEETLRASEQRFRNVLDGMDEAFGLMDHEMRIITQNQAALRLDGRPLEEIRGRTHWEVYPGSEDTELGRLYKRALAEGVPVSLEHRYKWPGGGESWLDMRAYPVPEGLAVFWRDITERKAAEEALRVSEERHRRLFDSIDEGVCLIERLPLRPDGRRDYRYIAMNPAMQAMFGIPDLSGQSIRDNFPDEVEDWYDDYDHVLETGEALRFERASEPQGMVLEMFVTRVEDGAGRTLLAVMQDVTARKQQERRQEFLLKLNDALRFQSDAVEIQAAVTESVMNHFGADRCYYCEIQDDKAIIRRDAARANLPSVAGIYPLKDFPLFTAMINGGVPLVVQDARVTELMDAALKQLCVQMKIISFINVPVVKNNRYIGNLCITRSVPGDWEKFEVKLAEDSAERTWAAVERARAEEALRESEQRMRLAIQATQMVIWEWLPSEDSIKTSDNFAELYGLPALVGAEEGFAIVLPEDKEAHIAKVQKISAEGGIYNSDFRIKRPIDGRIVWLEERAEAQLDSLGKVERVIGVTLDITERKHAEEALRESEKRQSFMLKLSDILRPLADPAEIQQAACRVLGEHTGASRVLYSDVYDEKEVIITNNYVNGVSPIIVRLNAEEFGLDLIAAYKRGEQVVFSDAASDPRFTENERRNFAALDIAANVSLGLVKGGKWIAAFGMHNATPREWTPLEITLLEETAERTWAAVERARAEAALRTSETRIRIALDAAQMATWEWHLRTGEIFWNEQHFLLFGMTPRTTPTTPADFFTHVHPDDRTWLGATLQTSIDQRHVFQAEFRSLSEDGSQRWMSGYGHVVAEENGQATRMSGVMFDITERKEAEVALRESEARQAIILETMAEGVVTIDREGRFFSANAAAERILGVSRTELIGQSINTPPYQRFDLEGTPWGDRPVLAEIAAAGQRIFHHDYVIERRNGSRVVVSRNITALHTDDGTLLGFVSTLSDITEQKRAETALRDSEERFRAVANLVPDLLWSNDPDGVTDWYNQRWLEYTGQTLAEASNYGWLDAIHPDDRANSLHNFQTAVEQGQRLRQEHRIRSATGEYRWFLVQANPLKDATGKILRWFGAATDIHDQRIARETLERRVQERTQALEALSVSRQQLLDRIITAQEDERRRIAHELHDTLGQFLSALNLRLSLLQQSVQPSDGTASPVVEELGQLWQLVNEIDSELRRLTMELRPPILDDLGLDEAIRRYAEAWSQTTAIPVDVYTAGFTGERLAHTIELPIYRIVQEALTNVLKHAQASSVSVILERRPKELQLIIEDNGVGFDPNAVGSQEEGRHPLGLIGMKERAALVSGRVDLETTPGAGTTVYVHIPLHAD